jgi:FkbM family methyltransferase
MQLTKIKNKLYSLFVKEKITERSDYLNAEKKSFSQSGEDLIVDYIFRARGVTNITYLDIGANHPLFLNNTYRFYLRGCKGVNIEPNPLMIERFLNTRPNDISIQAGAAVEEGELIYYELDTPELNTFSKEHALYMAEKGHSIFRETSIPVITINTIIEKYFDNKAPNVVFIDAEGMDFVLVESFDFESFQPEVFCVESVTYELDGTGIKDDKLINLIKSKGYLLYADTNINSIFVRKDFWLT